MIETAFADLMARTVTIYASTALDAYGKSTYSGTGVTAKCAIVQTGKVVKNDTNRDVYEEGKLIFYGNPTITDQSKIVLPDGSSPVILSVTRYFDERGSHHTSVSYGRS